MVPIEFPGDRVPPLMVVAPTLPLPASVPPAFTVTGPVTVPLTLSRPPFTVALPEISPVLNVAPALLIRLPLTVPALRNIALLVTFDVIFPVELFSSEPALIVALPVIRPLFWAVPALTRL